MDAAVPEIRWDEDPRLIIAWRESRKITGRRVVLDETTFDDVREIAEAAVSQLEASEPRPYEPFAELEEGEEFFQIPIDDLPRQPEKARTKTQASADGHAAVSDTASLLAITSDPDGLPRVAAQDLDQSTYLFYGLVFSLEGGGAVTFIRKVDPVKQARAARLNLSGRDALHRMEPPALTLLHGVDLVATPTNMLVLRKSPFDQLLNDVRIALKDAPENVVKVESALSAKVGLSGKAKEALTAVATKRPSVAVRLRALPERIAAINLTAENVRERLRVMGNAEGDLLDGDEFDFPAARVGLFIDLVEGRYFDDEWTGDRMKADRMSRYRPS